MFLFTNQVETDASWKITLPMHNIWKVKKKEIGNELEEENLSNLTLPQTLNCPNYYSF